MNVRERRLPTCVCLLLLLGAPTLSTAGAIIPPGPPSPTMKRLDEVEPRQPIHAADLPKTISSPGSYYLVEDMRPAGGGITIDADSVTIDLMGYALSGGTGSGIQATFGKKNIVILNGTVSSWAGDGIDLAGTRNAVVSSVRAEANGGAGIRVGDGTTITMCIADRNGGGGIIAATGCLITQCEASVNDGDGVTVGTNSSIVESVATLNTGDGLRVFSGDGGALIRGCGANRNTGDGIEVDGPGSVVVGNDLSDNGSGIHVITSWNRIEANHLVNNSGCGVDLGVAGNVMVKNTAGGNGVNYCVVNGNDVGPVGSASTSSSAWANIEF